MLRLGLVALVGGGQFDGGRYQLQSNGCGQQCRHNSAKRGQHPRVTIVYKYTETDSSNEYQKSEEAGPGELLFTVVAPLLTLDNILVW
jgi:hypothetical protein